MDVEGANKVSRYYQDKWKKEAKARKQLLKTSNDFNELEEKIKLMDELITTSTHARDIMKSQQMKLINECINNHFK